MDPIEIVNGLRKTFNIVLSREEQHILISFLDEDKSGSISFEEFTTKISLKDYQKRSGKFLVSEKCFIDKILSVWYDYRAVEKQRLNDFIFTFDDNGDRII